MGVVVERGVPCPMRDGTVLAADVFRPDEAGRYPVLVQRTPYDKGFYPFTWPMIDPLKAAASGFVVVIQDVRGRFGSAGTFEPWTSEADDGEDTVAWAASQPWSNGAVGCYGISYMGGTSWLTASRRPEALKGIAVATSPNESRNNHIARGGAISLGLLAAWTVMSIGPHALTRALRDDLPTLVRELVGLIDDADALDDHLRAVPLLPFAPINHRAGGFAPWLDERLPPDDLDHGRVPATPPSHTDIAVPALITAGWYDVMLAGDLEHYTAMKTEAATEDARRLTKIVIGPWAHAAFTSVVGEVDFGLRTSPYSLDLREDFTTMHARWFRARLLGEATGIDDEPPVKLFVMGRNRWRTEDAWPLARAKTTRWHLHEGGRLDVRPPQTDTEPSLFSLDPEDPVPTLGGNLLMHPKHIRGPREQRRIEERPDVLLFTSEPVAEDLEVTGPVSFTAWVAASTVDTDIVARLCDVHPDGRSYNVCDGILRLRFREGLGSPKPLSPGEPVCVQVDMWSTSYVFLQGHRLRLQVCASDFPRYDRCPGTGESSTVATRVLPQRNTLFHDSQRPSYLDLPEVRT